MSEMEELFERIEINEARIKRKLINKGRMAGIIENKRQKRRYRKSQERIRDRIAKFDKPTNRIYKLNKKILTKIKF